MTNKDYALRTVAKFLRCVSMGAPATADDFKVFSDLCWLALPMKYRMSRSEIEELNSKSWETKTGVIQ